MFGLRQQVVRKTLQRAAQRKMGTAKPAEAETFITQGRLPPELNLPWTAEQQTALEAWSKEFRAHHEKQIRQPIFNPKFSPYSDAEYLKTGTVPKYSRDFVNILGIKREARVFWLFPVYFTVAVVGSTYCVEYLGEDFFIRPFKALLPPTQDA